MVWLETNVRGSGGVEQLWQLLAPLLGQVVQALLKNQIGQGSWRCAALLVPYPDPCASLDFASSAELLADTDGGQDLDVDEVMGDGAEGF